MKATVELRPFLSALREADLVRCDQIIPILSMALARFGPDSHIVATDLDQELTIPIDAVTAEVRRIRSALADMDCRLSDRDDHNSRADDLDRIADEMEAL